MELSASFRNYIGHIYKQVQKDRALMADIDGGLLFIVNLDVGPEKPYRALVMQANNSGSYDIGYIERDRQLRPVREEYARNLEYDKVKRYFKIILSSKVMGTI